MDGPAGGESTDQTGRRDLPQLGIDLHLGKHGTVRMQGVVRLRRRVGCDFALPVDFRNAALGEDFAIALAAGAKAAN